jgi:hypothetical protein
MPNPIFAQDGMIWLLSSSKIFRTGHGNTRPASSATIFRHKLAFLALRLSVSNYGVATRRILSLSYDRSLMSIRCAILRSAGYQIVEVYSLDDALRFARLDAIDVLLICHTVPKEEQCKLTLSVRAPAAGLCQFSASSPTTLPYRQMHPSA